MTTITLRGELDLSTISVLRSAIVAAENSGAQRIVLDLSGVDFIDARGLRALLDAARSARDGGRLRMRVGPGPVARVLELTATADVLPIAA